MEEKRMIEIIGGPRVPTEEELQELKNSTGQVELSQKNQSTDRPEGKPEWQQEMLNNFLRRPGCRPDCFGAAAGDCPRCR